MPGSAMSHPRFDPRRTNPFPWYDTEIRRIRTFLIGLDGNAWRRPSHCAGWSVKDVVAHLADDEVYNEACLDGTIGEINFAGGLDAYNQRGVRRRRTIPSADVLREWGQRQRRVRRAWGRIGLSGKLQTSVGPYPLRLQAWHLAREYAIHADDIKVPVPPNQRKARWRWRIIFGLFAAKEEGEPIDARITEDTVKLRLAAATHHLDLETFVAYLTHRPQQLEDTARRRLVSRLLKEA